MTQRKKHLLRGGALMLALILCLTGVGAFREVPRAAAEEQEIVPSYPYNTVTKDKVNMRASRSTSARLVIRIPAGAEISVLAKNGNWVQVEYSSKKGWVVAQYVVLKTVKVIKVTPTPTPVPTLTPEENAGGYTILKRGSTGRDVRSLQEALIEMGYLNGIADGNFGASTESAVIAFQRKNNGGFFND